MTQQSLITKYDNIISREDVEYIKFTRSATSKKRYWLTISNSRKTNRRNIILGSSYNRN